MLEMIKNYKINEIEYELMRFSMDLPSGYIEYYLVYIAIPFSSKIYEKRFDTKEKALEYILNKIMIKGAN